MTPAPIKKGGVNVPHGRTFHQSSDNTSDNCRRAMAIHFIQKEAKLVNSIFEFDYKHYVKAY
jgi:ectoine hydroxylase-related dioxygenase (phytanoyl-CoA dioxygenase family)